jgi:hypothetical protein
VAVGTSMSSAGARKNSTARARYFSINTETEPIIPKPKELGIDIWKEPIGTYSVGSKFGWEPKNRTDRFGKYRTPRPNKHPRMQS